MCGFAGIAGDSARTFREDALHHRGPDALGVWTSREASLWHWRLKIIDLSDNAAQPMENEDGTVALVFNGEIYNYKELRTDLLRRGHLFRSQSDTEVIVHLFEEEGTNCVNALSGMFAFAIWDKKEKALFCARDRFGKKPFLYTTQKSYIAFASEIAPLIESGLSSRDVDEEGLAFFWFKQYIPAPWTAFRQVRKLPAAHCLLWKDGQLRTWRYYAFPREDDFKGDYGDAVSRVRESLVDATRRRLVADVPLGLCLSGGIDSACIAAAAKIAGAQVQAFTVRPEEPNSLLDEGEPAHCTANRLKLNQKDLFVRIDFAECLDNLLKHFGEPFADASMIPSYYLFKALKENATVALSGDGGDEVFGGYTYYRQSALWQMAKDYVPHILRDAVSRGLQGCYRKFQATRKYLKAPILALQMLEHNSPPHPAYGLRTEVAWDVDRLLTDHAVLSWSDRLIQSYKETIDATSNHSDQVKHLMRVDQIDWLPNDVLCKVDTCSMSHAVEVRSPLLDVHLAELAQTLPRRFFFDRNSGKTILKDAFRQELDPSVLSRPKTGFGLPLRDALRGHLLRFLEDSLLPPHRTFNRYFRQNAVAAILNEHATGVQHHTALLFRLLIMRRWVELFDIH